MKEGWARLSRWKARMLVRVNKHKIEEVPVTTLAVDIKQARRLAEDAGFKFDGPVTGEEEVAP